ncbi:MAG: hypothetical protein ACODAA_00315 [Gemmatimonadota bacterium]
MPRHFKREPGRSAIRAARAFGTGTFVMLMMLVGLAACGADEDGTDAGAAAAGQGTATIRLGEHTHTLDVRTCDVEAAEPHDVILRGFGTMPDGRQLRVELELLSPGDADGVGEAHSVWVVVGGVTEGESWEAMRRTGADGAWYVGEWGNESAPGPLIEISDRSVTVEAPLHLDESDEVRQAEITAECPA